MGKKTQTPEQKLRELGDNIEERIARWTQLNEHGGTDPFWPDGSNMNLVRNHILYYKHQIRELCEENNLALPDAYYLATPPEVDNNYMASLQQHDRVKRLKQFGTRITRKKTVYDLAQTSLF